MADKNDGFVPLEVANIKPNTPEWLKERRQITASSAACKSGISADSSAQSEAWWEIHHPGEPKPDPNGYMSEGHVEEEHVADRCAPIIFPFPDLMLPEGQKGDGLQEVGMFLHPEYPKWISATPDRLVVGHREPRVVLEIKYSRHLLRPRPKVDHLCQVHLFLLQLLQTLSRLFHIFSS